MIHYASARCTICGESKLRNRFHPGDLRPGSNKGICAECRKGHEGQKRCTACRRWKATAEFTHNRSCSDGLTSYCRICVERYKDRLKISRLWDDEDSSQNHDPNELRRRIETARAAKQAAFGRTLAGNTLAVILGDQTMDEDNRRIKVVREPAKAPTRDECKDRNSQSRIPCGGGYRIVRKRIGTK